MCSAQSGLYVLCHLENGRPLIKESHPTHCTGSASLTVSWGQSCTLCMCNLKIGCAVLDRHAFFICNTILRLCKFIDLYRCRYNAAVHYVQKHSLRGNGSCLATCNAEETWLQHLLWTILCCHLLHRHFLDPTHCGFTCTVTSCVVWKHTGSIIQVWYILHTLCMYLLLSPAVHVLFAHLGLPY